MPRSLAEARSTSARPTDLGRTGGLTATGGGHRPSICWGDPDVVRARQEYACQPMRVRGLSLVVRPMSPPSGRR
jgi:hypothetical protein